MSGPVAPIGLFGGSFDPVHRGHVDPVLEAALELGLEKVFYLPTAHPPHKPDRRFAPALARYCMVELALLDHPSLVVSDFELTGDARAYTIDTVREFQRRYPGSEIHLLLGADSFRDLESWRSWRELLQETHVVVLARPGEDLDGAPLPAELAAASREARVTWAENRQWRLSSTDLRRRLATGESPTAEAMAPAVLRFCRKYALYR